MIKTDLPVWEVIVIGGGSIFAAVMVFSLTLSSLSLLNYATGPTARANQPSQPTADKATPNKITETPTVAPPTAAPAPASGQSGTIAATAAPREIGMFVSNSADDPQAGATLDKLHGMGVTVVYNYALIDGSAAQIQAYLDRARYDGIKVIISLKDLYDQLPDGAMTATSHPEFGDTNEAVAMGLVQRFGGHPAVWGFGLTDEAPMEASELGVWQPTLRDRYVKLKTITTKPVMAVLVGKTSPSAATRRSFLSALRSSTDSFALDFYPVPFEPIATIESIGGDLPAVGDTNGWFIEQAFSWSRYADTARSIGYNPAGARNPTTAEMVNMGRLALRGGARNLMFYSYFDIQNDPAQVAAVTAAIRQLK
jgi:hypothetical protein